MSKHIFFDKTCFDLASTLIHTTLLGSGGGGEAHANTFFEQGMFRHFAWEHKCFELGENLDYKCFDIFYLYHFYDASNSLGLRENVKRTFSTRSVSTLFKFTSTNIVHPPFWGRKKTSIHIFFDNFFSTFLLHPRQLCTT